MDFNTRHWVCSIWEVEVELGRVEEGGDKYNQITGNSQRTKEIFKRNFYSLYCEWYVCIIRSSEFGGRSLLLSVSLTLVKCIVISQRIVTSHFQFSSCYKTEVRMSGRIIGLNTFFFYMKNLLQMDKIWVDKT